MTTTFTGRATTLAATEWQRAGLCLNEDPDLFFPSGEKNPTSQDQVKKAVSVCVECPVRGACLQWALDNKLDHGVWGGLTEKERQRLHHRRPTRFDRGNVKTLDHILNDRLEDFLRLEKEGLAVQGIARELGTNVQTVNRVRKVLEQREMEAAA